MMNRCLAVLFCWVLWGILIPRPVCANDSGSQSDLPRYRFEVGQEMVYELVSASGTGEAESGRQKQWSVYVVRRNKDGSWRLLIHTRTHFGKGRPKTNSLGYCDIYANGSYVVDRQAIFKKLFPFELFCRLPDRPSQLDAGWTYEPPLATESLEFSLTALVRSSYSFLARKFEPRLIGCAGTMKFEFDAASGLVTEITSETNDSATNQNRETIKLVSVARHDSKWISHFQTEANRYLADCDQWIELGNDALWTDDAAEASDLLRKALATLADGRDKTMSELLRTIYEVNIQEHDALRSWATEYAAMRGRWFAASTEFPSAWKADTFGGVTVDLADQRGKVVVLDFWSTDCGYCIPVGSQIASLEQEFRDTKVIFLGMFARGKTNSEKDSAHQDAVARNLCRIRQDVLQLDAKHVADLYQLESFGFGCPTVIVLDQAGRPHAIHLGYSADLPERLRNTISRLLKSGAGASHAGEEPGSLEAGPSNPSDASFDATLSLSSASDSERLLTVRMTVPAGWKSFASVPDGATNTVTQIHVDMPEGVRALGTWHRPMGFPEDGGSGARVFAGTTVFTRRIAVPNDSNGKQLGIRVDYQLCSDRACMPSTTWSKRISIGDIQPR